MYIPSFRTERTGVEQMKYSKIEKAAFKGTGLFKATLWLLIAAGPILTLTMLITGEEISISVPAYVITIGIIILIEFLTSTHPVFSCSRYISSNLLGGMFRKSENLCCILPFSRKDAVRDFINKAFAAEVMLIISMIATGISVLIGQAETFDCIISLLMYMFPAFFTAVLTKELSVGNDAAPRKLTAEKLLTISFFVPAVMPLIWFISVANLPLFQFDIPFISILCSVLMISMALAFFMYVHRINRKLLHDEGEYSISGEPVLRGE